VLAATVLLGIAAHQSLAASRTVAAAPECPLNGTRVVGFARALDGGGFVTTDGEEVRLSGVLAFGAGGEPASEPAASAARWAARLPRAFQGKNVVHSAFVEEAGKWVIFPGEAPNMLLELLHANEWFGNHDSGASGR